MPKAVNCGWRKSTSSGQQTNCVEVMELPDRIAVRDSKNPDGAVLVAGATAWRAFVEYVR